MSYAFRLLHMLRLQFRLLLDLSALLLGIVNGLFLLKFYLRDRPKLAVRAVNPGCYQWWFKMPGDEYQGNKTRTYGFLAYVDIQNKGLRKTELDSWWLCIQTKRDRKHRLDPINMPEPKITVGKLDKFYPVLGQKGIHSDGSTLTEPGCSTTGMVFFEYECYGDESWDPVIHNAKIATTFVAKSIFGQTCRCDIEFSEKSLDEMDAMAPGIHLTSKSGRARARQQPRPLSSATSQ